jgi:hypothetical protein
LYTERKTLLKENGNKVENIPCPLIRRQYCFLGFFFFFFLFICAYNVWVISPLFTPPPPLLPCPLPLSPNPSPPGRNYFALTSNFVEERV